MIKAIFYTAIACMLCACATGSDFHSSYSLNGMTSPSMDMNDMHFYMDDDKGQAPILSNPNYRFDDQGSGVMCDKVCRF